MFLESSVYVVEVPVREHGKPEVKEAKEKEIQNLETYETFEEVEDKGQETIGSRWIVTKKEKHDGQKQMYKARLVARGFQEKEQPQSDSPTAAKESFKLLMALAANNGFKLGQYVGQRSVHEATRGYKEARKDMEVVEASIWIG